MENPSKNYRLVLSHHWSSITDHPDKPDYYLQSIIDHCAKSSGSLSIRSSDSYRVKDWFEPNTSNMHLMYYLDAEGKRVYTLKASFLWTSVLSRGVVPRRLQRIRSTKYRSNQNHRYSLFLTISYSFYHLPTTPQKETPNGKITESAHPARFSPDDKFSRQRISCKKRFGIYLPQTPQKPL